MNDNMNYDDEIFERIPENAENNNENGKKSPEKVLRIILGAVIAALVVVIVLASVLLASNSGDDESTSLPDETTTLPVETTTSPAEKYKPGQYTVNVGENGTLNLRKEPSKDGEQILGIPNKTLLTITEVKYDETAEEGSQHWGRTVYLGWDAWVSMTYLANAYSENIVTPDEQTSAEETSSEESATVSEEPSSAASAETSTEYTPAETSTNAPETTTQGSASGAFSTGKYTVDAQPHLNMRDDHSVDALSIAQIPDKSEITITDVYYDENAADAYTKYWGKTTFGGVTGWVAMGYLDN